PASANDPDRRAAEYVFSIGGAVRVNDEERELKAAAGLPKNRFTLTAVNLGGNTAVTDAGLTIFKDCKNLISLDLSGTPVTDAGLAHFKDCKSLTRLVLYNSQATDTGLAYFKDCKGLTHLNAGAPQVTGAGLANFKDCN